ncbi:311b209a-319d-4070-8869-af2bfc593f84 [Sclerotinia trifoliorum]|uniref:311b209a-319d-4070-8869-af2bfc593f84 n=1 Tax=Sclerotinia trifoliorum TaxID=28548 RepID=A0A8H2VNZ7_9HELO|nr:311b209a-319d-4070-8869-af2bfc593f84 [Sclerotinia trifoliorum]
MACGWLSSPIMKRKWKYPRVIIWLNVIELAGTIAALIMFGIADPDLYRTSLWQIGYDNGFNSSPAEILYAYANYRPIPKIAFVWSQTLQNFNVGISVLSMFIQLCKVVMFIMHVWWPLLSTVINGLLTVCWIVSIYGQAGPDHTDPKHPSNVAWYVAKSCSYARPSGNEHYCQMAKGTFAVTVFMMIIYLANTILGIDSLIPSRLERSINALDLEDNLVSTNKAGKRVKTTDSPEPETPWEMQDMSQSADLLKQPFTPRTMAFKSLDRQLPLRATSAPRFA